MKNKMILHKVIGTEKYNSIIGQSGNLNINVNSVQFEINNTVKISTYIDLSKYATGDLFVVFKDMSGISFIFKKQLDIH